MRPQVIAGRYRLVELLGQGAMSEVWSADDQELDRPVALKLLASGAGTSRFEREARAAASLSHPNITRVYDYGESSGRPFLVLEYVPGGTLEDRLRDDVPLRDAETLAIATGVAAALAHAHSCGVIHRDLKPANVLFDAEGRPKLADFGIARLAAGGATLTQPGTLLGTAAYISPEQAAGEPATPASDVYSFGVTLYRMLTGRLPFASSDPVQLLMLHRSAEPPPVASYRSDAPAALEALALAALAKDPGKRPADGAALLARLPDQVSGEQAAPAALLEDEPTQRLVPAPQDSALAPRRRPPLMIAAVPLLALAGVLLAYGVTRPGGDSNPARTLPPPSGQLATRGASRPSNEPTQPAGQATTAHTAARTGTSPGATSKQEPTTATTGTTPTTSTSTTTAATTPTATTSITTTTTAPPQSTGTTP